MARARRPSVDRRRLALRLAAPAAFLLAATIGVLLVRSALHDEPEPAGRRAATTAATTAPRPAPPRRQRPRTETQPANYYIVQSGDTLGTIADDHDTSVARLLELNPRVDPRSLTIGQRIRVP